MAASLAIRPFGESTPRRDLWRAPGARRLSERSCPPRRSPRVSARAPSSTVTRPRLSAILTIPSTPPSADEAATVIAWRRFALRCRDLFLEGEDTSWYEIGDENGAVAVETTAPVRPEPVGGALFAVVHAEGSLRRRPGPDR